jgi:hypothetical protein
MLDFPAFGQALWGLYGATGIRPEYAIVSMMLESGLNPGAVNGVGCTGLNQMCAGIPEDYASWTASQQVTGVITPFWIGLVKRYGAIESGARLEQGNMYPASLAYARSLSSVIVSTTQDKPAYDGNKGAFDPGNTGAITVQGIADALRKLASSDAVQSAIDRTYAVRSVERPKDPVYGDDFGFFERYGREAALGAGALALGASFAWEPAWPLRAWKTVRRVLWG